MTTFGEMQERIASELHRDDLSNSDSVRNAIKSAIKQYERERWYFNEATTSSSLTTSDGQAYYALPDNFMKLDSLKITYNGWKNNVSPIGYIEMDEMDAGNSSVRDLPTFCAVYKNNLRLYPIPDSAYVQTISYQKRLTTLSATSDTNEWTDDLEELIRQKAKEILCRDVIRDFALADQIALYIERSVYPRLRAENDERLMDGRLKPYF